jgi:hypothetical protein
MPGRPPLGDESHLPLAVAHGRAVVCKLTPRSLRCSAPLPGTSSVIPCHHQSTERRELAADLPAGVSASDGHAGIDALRDASPGTAVILLIEWGQRLVAEGDVPAEVDCVLSMPPPWRRGPRNVSRSGSLGGTEETYPVGSVA